MTMTRGEFIACQGLQDGGQAFVSASEAGIALRLAERNLVKIWQTGEGFSAWRLTEEGKIELERERVRFRA